MRILLSIFIIIFTFNVAFSKEVEGKLSIGQKIPENLGVGLDGKDVIASDHLGKVMVISFWASWCPPCMKELPVINNLQKLGGKERLSVIAINFGEKGRTYRRFVKKVGDVNLTFTLDKKGKIGRDTFGVYGIPHMLMIDHEGKIAQIHTGYGDDTINNIANEINELFRKQAAGP